MQSSHFLPLSKKLVFDENLNKNKKYLSSKFFLPQDTWPLRKLKIPILDLYIFLLTSHCSTSAHESPSTPSVLQTAYAKGSTVSSVISEPILPTPLTPTVFPLLHYTNGKNVNIRKKLGIMKILFWILLTLCSQQASVKEPRD